jgi:hypothetical protein
VTDEHDPVTPGDVVQTAPTGQAKADSSLGLSALAGLATAAFAITGALWFGLLSLAAAIAYEPAGVRPREIGLSSGTVLTQSAVGLVAWVVVFGVANLIYAIVLGTWLRIRRDRWLAEEPELRESLERSNRRLTQRLIATFLTLLFGLFVVVASRVIGDAQRARDALREGRRAKSSSFLTFGAPSPWSGEIVRLAWVAQKPEGAPALPNCALYLGEASGTTVIYSAAKKRTWRLPSSSLIVTAKPNADRC